MLQSISLQFLSTIHFSSVDNALYGLVIVLLILAMAYKAYCDYKINRQEKFLFLAVMFLFSALFETLHSCIIWGNHYIEFLNVFVNRMFQCIGLLGILFIGTNPPDKQINKTKYALFFVIVASTIILEYFVVRFNLTEPIFPDLLNIVTSFIFISILFGFSLTRMFNKEPIITSFNIGLLILSLSSLYIIDIYYYESFYRHIVHILRVAGNLLLFLGFNDIKQSVHQYNLRLKLILLPNIYMIFFYILFIVFGDLLFDINLTRNIYTGFVIFYTTCLIIQSISVERLTRPLAQIKEKLTKIIPGEKPPPIKLEQDDEIGLLAQKINSVWQTQWSYFQEINKKQNQIQALMHNRDSFIAALSHDLKSPIFAEQKLIESLLETKENIQTTDIIDYLEEMYQINDEVLRIANNLLASHHLECDEFELNLEETDLNILVKNITKTLQYLAKESNIKLHLNLEKNLIKIEADKDLISRVITNLISNAIKHSKKSTKIEISTYSQNEQIAVSIQDNGKGISEEEKVNIFKKYPGEKRKVGTGLGLYISQQIISAHKGKIWFETEIDKGTTFCFTLPVKH
jgi:signal transduction histidine kinase